MAFPLPRHPSRIIPPNNSPNTFSLGAIPPPPRTPPPGHFPCGLV